ncbi:uncharacterized protein LOC106655792 [Trichogramma pretiosum]|uniref:uncharacterized protein LOC106655792 n=1 Tax=Trichogramma pretiosum TaxID=7493 RepID=UPI000C71ADD5|nr:uncharacterized protein LOC106655792 [Trichogramma pretiosum]
MVVTKDYLHKLEFKLHGLCCFNQYENDRTSTSVEDEENEKSTDWMEIEESFMLQPLFGDYEGVSTCTRFASSMTATRKFGKKPNRMKSVRFAKKREASRPQNCWNSGRKEKNTFGQTISINHRN